MLRQTGFSAEDVAAVINIDRTNASRDLNLLAQEGIIQRIPGRPVLFKLAYPLQSSQTELAQDTKAKDRSPAPVLQKQDVSPAPISASIPVGAFVTSFETLIGYDEGLKVAVQQAKAAILYPPRGLHTLLYGASGVGKTTLARLMYAFALEQKALPANAPFVSFNCADYAGNSRLLMSHLFGVVEGAYAGAVADRPGLVEQAHHGILFLDEVHRLPPEGQEMLLYLMDHEQFRRLGDTRERHASLLLLAATTEDPQTALLPTFRRRIPMLITLPGLDERTITERYELIRAFFTAECSTIGTNIHVPPQVLRALLLYTCPGNIGQLRTDVQLTCARAYLDYRTTKQPELHLSMDTLPEHISRGFLHATNLQRTLAPVQHLLHADHVFTPTGLSLNGFPESTRSLYETINIELASLQKSGLPEHEINALLQMDIERYFQHFASSIPQDQSLTSSSLVDERILLVAQSIIQRAEEQLHRLLPSRLALVLALHLSSALDHAVHGPPLNMPVLPNVQQTYPNEYEIAREALLRIQTALHVSLPASEVNVIAVLLAHADTLLSNKQTTVGIVIAAHGHGVAAGIAELANTLVGVHAVSWVELTLEQAPEEVLTRIEDCVSNADQGCGVLLCVDFATLHSVGTLITRRTGIQVRTITGVNAPLVVDAVRRAQRSEHVDLDQLSTSLVLPPLIYTPDKMDGRSDPALSASEAEDKVELDPRGAAPQASRVILSVCLTGYGSAAKIAELLEERLPELREQDVEIICMDIGLAQMTDAEIQQLVGNRPIVAVVGTVNPHLQHYLFISLTDILFKDGTMRLRALLGRTFIDPGLLQPSPDITDVLSSSITIQRSDLLREIAHTLSQRMLFLNPARALPFIEQTIERIETQIGERFDLDVLAGLFLHLTCVMEQGMQAQRTISEAVRSHIERAYARELAICQQAWHRLSEQIDRPLPEDEVYNIVSILKHIDIFVPEL